MLSEQGHHHRTIGVTIATHRQWEAEEWISIISLQVSRGARHARTPPSPAVSMDGIHFTLTNAIRQQDMTPSRMPGSVYGERRVGELVQANLNKRRRSNDDTTFNIIQNGLGRYPSPTARPRDSGRNTHSVLPSNILHSENKHNTHSGNARNRDYPSQFTLGVHSLNDYIDMPRRPILTTANTNHPISNSSNKRRRHTTLTSFQLSKLT